MTCAQQVRLVCGTLNELAYAEVNATQESETSTDELVFDVQLPAKRSSKPLTRHRKVVYSRENCRSTRITLDNLVQRIKSMQYAGQGQMIRIGRAHCDPNGKLSMP